MTTEVNSEATGRSLAAQFHPRANSLNAVRLALAAAVIVSHGFAITGREEPAIGGRQLGGWAVLGFFSVSGFLITRSAEHLPVGAYLRARALRIVPGFVAALIITAFVFAPLGAAVSDGATWNLGEACTYVLRNLPFYPPGLYQEGIGHLAFRYWNGPLYTLFYEVLCYLAVVALVHAVPRRHLGSVLTCMTIILTVVAVAMANVRSIGDALVSHEVFVFGVPLGLSFCAGALLWTYRERVPMTPLTPAAAAIVMVGLIGIQQAPGLSAIPVAILVLWAGTRPELVSVGRRFDISYGLYIYGWPVQVLLLLAVPTARGWSVALNIAVVLGATAALAVASCVIIEQPALRRKH